MQIAIVVIVAKMDCINSACFGDNYEHCVKIRAAREFIVFVTPFGGVHSFLRSAAPSPSHSLEPLPQLARADYQSVPVLARALSRPFSGEASRHASSGHTSNLLAARPRLSWSAEAQRVQQQQRAQQVTQRRGRPALSASRCPMPPKSQSRLCVRRQCAVLAAASGSRVGALECVGREAPLAASALSTTFDMSSRHPSHHYLLHTMHM